VLLWEDEHIQAFTPMSLEIIPVTLKEVLTGSCSNMTHCSNLWMSCRTHMWGSFPDLCKASQRPLLLVQGVYNC